MDSDYKTAQYIIGMLSLLVSLREISQQGHVFGDQGRANPLAKHRPLLFQQPLFGSPEKMGLGPKLVVQADFGQCRRLETPLLRAWRAEGSSQHGLLATCSRAAGLWCWEGARASERRGHGAHFGSILHSLTTEELGA